jgi:hypothetical protein|tara:strand:+ start:151 stop:627 length:477 start_codon:yes stop_codon:yes gene_type:complete
MECTICYNNILDINKVITECNHVFHFSCLLKNFKSNPSTGEQCPLCRKSFLQSPPINNSNTYIPPSNASSILQILRQRFLQPPTPPPPRNEIVRNIQRRRERIRVTVRPVPRNRQIRKEIEKLTFNELKDRLRAEGLSARGYVRDNLERRLYNKLTRR